MRAAVIDALLLVSGVLPWAWFSALTFIVRPAAVGSLDEGYDLVGVDRALQAIALGIGGLLVIFGAWVLARVRTRITGSWLFTRRSVGRVAKWSLALVVLGYVVTILPAAAFVADSQESIPTEDYGVEWATIPWLAILGLATIGATVLFLVDAVGGLRQRGGDPHRAGESAST